MKVTNAGLQNDAETQDVSFETIFNGTAKAWVFGDSGAGLADSFNISSGTDHGTGDFSYAMTAGLTDLDYCQVGGGISGTPRIVTRNQDRDASNILAIEIATSSAAAVDSGQGVQVLGELA